MVRHRGVEWLAIIPLALSPSACADHAPGGQVVAVVNGHVLTSGDVQADLTSAHLSAAEALPQVRASAVRALVDRTLLADQARAASVDKEQAVKALITRAGEAVLATEILSRWRTDVAVPSASDIKQFTDQNPQIFGERTIYLLDEVRADLTGVDIAALDRMHSMDAAVELLRKSDKPFRRGSATIDTASLSLHAAEQLAALPRGEPFTSHRGRMLIIRSVVRSSSAPIADGQRVQLATELLERSAFRALVGERLRQLRGSATITYASQPPSGA